MTNKVEVFSQTLTAAGNGPAMHVHYQGSGLPPEVVIAGTFGGTSAQVQWSLDGITWINIGAAVTSAGAVTVNRLAKSVRVVLTGGTGINLTVTLGY